MMIMIITYNKPPTKKRRGRPCKKKRFISQEATEQVDFPIRFKQQFESPEAINGKRCRIMM